MFQHTYDCRWIFSTYPHFWSYKSREVYRTECVSHRDPTTFIWVIFGCVVSRISSDTFCSSYFFPYSCFLLFNSSCSILVPPFFFRSLFSLHLLTKFFYCFFHLLFQFFHFLFILFLFNLSLAFYIFSPLTLFFLYCYFCFCCSATVAFLCFLPSLLILNFFFKLLFLNIITFSPHSVSWPTTCKRRLSDLYKGIRRK